MNWLSPLLAPYVRPRAIRCRDGATMPEPQPRSVQINGVHYASMAEACEALSWSYRRVYKAIGEAWRYEKKPRGD